MLRKLLKHKVQIVLTALLVLLLALVRAYEDVLFYDPLLQYFKGDYQNKPLPSIADMKLFLSLLLRYAINAVLSLAIIHVIFRELQLTKFALILYVVFFIVLSTIFFMLISFIEQPNSLYLFYIRRFLIQPIFLLLFIPAFVFQTKQKQEV
ncbi:MAG TPA: exosortase F system-associated protein [Flavobacterium sp.]|jgi:exosortase F-associated protein|nr:exosortase F system-associated protein [Flavobacterium sp.]